MEMSFQTQGVSAKIQAFHSAIVFWQVEPLTIMSERIGGVQLRGELGSRLIADRAQDNSNGASSWQIKCSARLQSRSSTRSRHAHNSDNSLSCTWPRSSAVE